jgi:hypothetical protein
MVSLEMPRAAVERLAALDRESGSAGEHEAAEWIAGQLREQGVLARVELTPVHCTYWWPLGLTSALGIAAAATGRRGHRRLGALLGAAGSALVVDELTVRRRVLRRVLPKRPTANVLGWTGDPEAERTLIVVSHHDAAHSGFFFNPRFTEFLGRRATGGSSTDPAKAPPVMLPIVLGPAMAGLGALAGLRGLRRVGAAVCAGIILSFTDIALRATVPGANDNLTGVACLLALAEALRERPLRGLRVLLLSTGSEESLMEGMRAFAEAHFGELPPERTHILCVDSLGSPRLVLAEAEGMLHARSYDAQFKDLLSDCAREAGVELLRGMNMRFGTDGYLALRHGYPAATLMSVNEYGTAANYHWPTDTPDRVDYTTFAHAVEVCERVMRRLAAGALG